MSILLLCFVFRGDRGHLFSENIYQTTKLLTYDKAETGLCYQPLNEVVTIAFVEALEVHGAGFV